MSMPQAGDLAPEVALPDEHGTVHRLADRRGSWTVVYFYPKDDTPGCTTEACGFRDLHGELEGLDAQVWGISPDGAGSHAAFRAKYGLPFTLLSDEDHAVAEAYGAWGEKKNYGKTYMGIIRSSFLVDPDGRIAKAWPNVKADGHADQVLEALRAARGGARRLIAGMKRGFARGGRRAKPRGESSTTDRSSQRLRNRPGRRGLADRREVSDDGRDRAPGPPTPGARSGSW